MALLSRRLTGAHNPLNTLSSLHLTLSTPSRSVIAATARFYAAVFDARLERTPDGEGLVIELGNVEGRREMGDPPHVTITVEYSGPPAEQRGRQLHREGEGGGQEVGGEGGGGGGGDGMLKEVELSLVVEDLDLAPVRSHLEACGVPYVAESAPDVYPAAISFRCPVGIKWEVFETMTLEEVDDDDGNEVDMSPD